MTLRAAMAFLLLTRSPFGLPAASLGAHMDCGSVSLCGIMTLETGKGPGTLARPASTASKHSRNTARPRAGKYQHPTPSVHGIWPETGAYGSSKCIAPSVSSAQPSELISCYDDLGFEQHEWGKHGVCAGVKDAKDFFTQVCALATAPLKVMAATVSGGGDVTRAASDLKAAGYAIFDTDPKNAQVELSACADASGTWHLAAVSDFEATYGARPKP